MDFVFLGGIALLWGLIALFVLSLKKLEKPTNGRS